MSLPNISYIRIMGLDYKLSSMTRTMADLSKCRGFIDEDALEIHVQEDLPPQRTVEVILHECCHAIVDGTASYEPEDTQDSDEKLVTRLGRALTIFLRDNPNLIGWIQKKLCE